MQKKLNSWLNHTFESSGGLTPEFAQFARDYKSYITANLPEKVELVSFNIGHFDVSGFIKKADKFVYFSVPDVRYFKNEWNNNILIRTAEHDKDFTGGSNNNTTLENFFEKVERLF